MKIGDTYWLIVLLYIELALTILAGIAFLRIPRLGRRDYLGVGLILLSSVLIESITMIGGLGFHKNMNAVANMYSILTLPLAIIFYRRRIPEFSKVAATIIIIIFLSFSFINLFFIQGINGINSYTYTISNMGFMGLAVYYYATLFFQLSEHQSARGMFWINAAFLIYFSGDFFITLVINYLLNFLHSDLITLWTVEKWLGVILYSLLIYGLNKVRREYLSHIISI